MSSLLKLPGKFIPEKSKPLNVLKTGKPACLSNFEILFVCRLSFSSFRTFER